MFKIDIKSCTLQYLSEYSSNFTILWSSYDILMKKMIKVGYIISVFVFITQINNSKIYVGLLTHETSMMVSIV